MVTKRLSSVALILVLFMSLVGPSLQMRGVRAAPAQTTVTFNAVADAMVKSWDPDATFGDGPWLQLAYLGENEEAATLVRFDVSGIPPDAVVDSALLRLYLEDADNTTFVTTAVHRVTSAWQETSVTWNTGLTTAPWPLACTIDGEVGSYKSCPINSYAQSWIDTPSSNYGVLVRGPYDGTVNYTRWFQSHETMDHMPQLEITYHVSPYSFTGHVYEGLPLDTSAPLAGVTVELWGDEDESPEDGSERVWLASDLPTGSDGAFLLEWDRAAAWPYLHVIEIDLPEAISTGAVVDSPGYKKNDNVVSYRYDDLLETGAYAFGGIAFWDQFPVQEVPDLVATDLWPEGDQVCYQLQNVGTGVASGGHQAALFIDEIQQALALVPDDLVPDARWQGCFDHAWSCTGENDALAVFADATGMVPESNEENNVREEVWDCDRTPPQIIAGPTVASLTTTSATITWETDEAADSVVRYDTVARLTRFEATSPSSSTSHEILLEGLTPSTTYHYVAISTDAAGNSVGSRDFLFETHAAPDTRNPTVDLRVPTVMTGAVTISGDANDDIGVSKVEFYLDNALAFTDFSPPYEWVFVTADVYNGDHTVEARAFDLYGHVAIDQMTIPVENFVDAQTPTVDIFFPTAGADVYGDTRVWVTVSDDSGWSEVEWFVDGSKKGGGQFPVSPTLDIMFWWDTTYFSKGSHSLAVQATDAQGKVGSDAISVNVANQAPPAAPDLDVISHKVFRHAHTFAIELTVQNRGQAAATGIQIVDPLRGFQPLARVFNGVTYETDFDTNAMRADALINDPLSLAAGASRTYYLAAVPVLIYDSPPVPSIGATIPMTYVGPLGTQVQESVQFEVLKTTETAGSAPSESMITAHANALREADYLIVTSPSHLFTVHPFLTAQVNTLLSDMAELAYDEQGVLGYMATPDRNTFRNLIRPNGDWAKRLKTSFSVTGGIGGYVLIVGETDIFPAWDLPVKPPTNCTWCSSTVHLSDHNYADTYAGWPPDIIVGRIIGENPGDLSKAIRTSTRGAGIDRSDALVVSGTGGGVDVFVQNADDVAGVLAGDGFTVDPLHWKNYATVAQRLQEFENRAPDKDLIFFRDHCDPDSWSDPSVLSTSDFPINFGSTNPFVFGCCCSSGDYERGDDENIAEAFFDNGAGVYIGSTQDSARDTNNIGCFNVIDNWDADTTIGWAFTLAERVLTTNSDEEAWWRYWVAEYNLYGDPKYGAAPPATLSAQIAPSEPVPTIDVTIPDYQVYTVDGLDHVEIPGGLLWLMQDAPQVPYYAYTVDYPSGYRVNDVVLEERSGLVTTSGLNLPLTTLTPNVSGGPAAAATILQEDWFPELPFTWQAVDHTDGSITLVIDIYPFRYQPSTTNVAFYNAYRFNVDYALSDVFIQDVTTDKGAYEQDAQVEIDVDLVGSTEGQEVYVSVFVTPYGSEEVVQGLLLETLTDMRGHASFAPQWDSTGLPPGYYVAHVVLKDMAGNLLDRRSVMVRIGIAAGEITSLSANPASFNIGQTIDATMVFENTGSVNLTGTACIKVQDQTGAMVEEYSRPFDGLAPGETATFDVAWDTTGAAEGYYAFVGYATYDSTATEVKVSKVSTDWPTIYLPLLLRNLP